MTVEDQMRATLADLAPVAPADEHAYAGVRRAVTRRKRRRAARRVAAVTVATVVTVVAAGGLAVRQRQDDAGLATDGMTAPRESFGGMTFVLPEGWGVIDESALDGAVDLRHGTERMCVGPTDNSYPRYEGCPGLDLYYGNRLPGNETSEYGQDGGLWSWYHRTDVMPCPDRPSDPATGYDNLDMVVPAGEGGEQGFGYAPVESRDVVVGGRTAAYDRWEARCERSGYTFSPQAWYLADEQVLILDVVNRPEAQAIVDSIEWADGG